MVNKEIMKSLAVKTESKIVLLVADGIGDLPSENNKTVLEKAFIPNLNNLASKSACGLTDPISCGITRGAGLLIFLCLDMTRLSIRLEEGF